MKSLKLLFLPFFFLSVSPIFALPSYNQLQPATPSSEVQERVRQAPRVIQQEATQAQQIRQEVRQEIQQQAQDLRTTITQQRQELQTERRSTLGQVKSNIVESLFARIRNRLENHYQYLLQVKVRAENRLTQLESQGLDTTTARQTLDQFTTLQAQYQQHLADLDQQVDLLLQSENPMQSLSQARQTANQVQGDLQKIHQNFTRVMQQLINLQNQ